MQWSIINIVHGSTRDLVKAPIQDNFVPTKYQMELVSDLTITSEKAA